jgi:DNA-directed RNA polymerase sigma subunit (sigma70/sigma32)
MEPQLADAIRDWHTIHLRRLGQTETSALHLRKLIQDAREAGATNQEIGDVLGVSRQRVSQILRKDVTK